MKDIFTVEHIYSAEEFNELIHNLSKAQKAKLTALSHKIKPVALFSNIDYHLNPIHATYIDRESGKTFEYGITSCDELKVLNEKYEDYSSKIRFKKKYYRPDEPVCMYDEEDPEQLKESFYGFIKSKDIFNTTFRIGSTFSGKAPKLVKIAQIQTYHTFGCFIKPSEAEVLLQIPKYLQKDAVAYEFHKYEDGVHSNLVDSGKVTLHDCYVDLFVAEESDK